MKYILLAVCLVALLAGTSVLADSKLQAMYASIFNSDGTFTEQVRNDLCSFPEHDFSSYSGDNWVGTDSTDPGHYDYEFTFCAVSEEDECKAHNGSLCQYDVTKDRKFTDSLASFSASPAPTVTYVDEETKTGLQLTFTNGNQCFDGFTAKDRIVVVNFTCDDTGDRVFAIVESPTCSYTVEIKHKLACANGGNVDGADGLSGGAIFLLIVLGVSVVYVLAGCAICVLKFGKPFGPQACPHRGFWCALPGLFLAGCGFTVGKIKGCFGSKTITTTSGEYEEA